MNVKKTSRATSNRSAQTPPTHIWADCDLSMPKSVRWAFYYSKADQRMSRPDLEPIKLRIVPNDGTHAPATKNL